MDRSTNLRDMGGTPDARSARRPSSWRMTTRNVPAFIPQIRRYQDWLRQHGGLEFTDYDALWQWSVTDLPAFWQSIWDYYDLQSPTLHSSVLAERRMPGARWFEGAQFNYVHQ